MITITKKQYEAIHPDFRGIWQREDVLEYVGKRTAMSGSISKEIGSLLIEDFHFQVMG